MDLDPDTKERNETLLHIEKQLENGHANDPATLTRGQLVVSKCVRVLQSKVAAIEKSKAHPINWPTAGIICSIIFGIIQLINNGGIEP